MCNFLDEPTSPERGGGPRAAWRWGFAVRRIPFGKYLGEFAETPLGSPAGGAGSPLGLTERATAPTPFWRVKGALKGMVVTNSPGLSQNRSCMLPLSVSLCSTAPPKGEPSGLLRIRPRFHKTIGAYRKPLSQALWACQLPFQGRFSRCPLWGKCREAAKGVSLVTLSCCHSSYYTPSVRPFGLPAPPKGEPSGLLRIRPRFHKTIGAYRKPLSQPRWACQLPFQGSQGRNQPPLSGARWVPYSSVVVISLTVLAMSKKGA